jgi:hypothetical protein
VESKKILPEANLDIRNVYGVAGLLIRISEGYVIIYKHNKMHELGPNRTANNIMQRIVYNEDIHDVSIQWVLLG